MMINKLFNYLNKHHVLRNGIGVIIVMVFVVSTVGINKTVQALNQAAGNYGYYGGSYGYSATDLSSDTLPAAPTSVGATAASSSSITVSWQAVTTTINSTSLDNFSHYTVVYSTSSSNLGLTTGSLWTSTNDSGLATQGSSTRSTTVTGLQPGQTYYFAVYASDTNGNDSASSSSTSVATNGAGGSSGGSGGGSGAGSIFSTPAVQTIVNSEGTTYVLVTSNGPVTLANIANDARVIFTGKLWELMGVERDTNKEKTTGTKYMTVLSKGMVISALAREDMIHFIQYGTPTTKALGAGERAGVLYSFKAAYGRLPKVEKDWSDVVKISNGRWPEARSTKAEKEAAVLFKQIYKRVANAKVSVDQNALILIAYGLRPAQRSLAKETIANRSVANILKKTKIDISVRANLIRMVAYSGAKR